MTGTILVTGGGRGIGAACALLAAEAGYRVAINFVSNENAALSVLGSVKAAGENDGVIVQGDVAAVLTMSGGFSRQATGLARLPVSSTMPGLSTCASASMK
ncbi:MAG: SDR family NAD(P)-dependent oxidoreductase [Nitratireductor sp.]